MKQIDATHLQKVLDKRITVHVDADQLERLRLFDNKILVRVIVREDKMTDGGIIIPRLYDRKSCTGVIVKTGDFCSADLQPGAQVIFNANIVDNPKLCTRLMRYGTAEYYYLMPDGAVSAVLADEVYN